MTQMWRIESDTQRERETEYATRQMWIIRNSDAGVDGYSGMERMETENGEKKKNSLQCEK